MLDDRAQPPIVFPPRGPFECVDLSVPQDAPLGSFSGSGFKRSDPPLTFPIVRNKNDRVEVYPSTSHEASRLGSGSYAEFPISYPLVEFIGERARRNGRLDDIHSIDGRLDHDIDELMA